MDINFDFVLAHWPLFAFALLCMVVIQVFKMAVWTEKRATGPGKAAAFFWWGRKTLSLQALIFGALVGLIPGMPIGGGFTDTIASKVLYYAVGGVLSTFLFNVLKGFAKRRGIDLRLPGLDEKKPPEIDYREPEDL